MICPSAEDNGVKPEEISTTDTLRLRVSNKRASGPESSQMFTIVSPTLQILEQGATWTKLIAGLRLETLPRPADKAKKSSISWFSLQANIRAKKMDKIERKIKKNGQDR